jgi:superfamily II DNA or RNA helicase
MARSSRIVTAPTMQLREYQRLALDKARAHMEAGRKRVLIVMPTGGGKTCTASEACREHVQQGGSVLWVAHRRELIKQGVATLGQYGLSVGAFGLNSAAPVQVESIQSLVHPSRREVPPATLVVADEAHHLMAEEWRKLAEIYNDCLLIGLTATPERGDGQPLGDIFNELVVAAQMSQLIALHEQDPTVGLVPCDVKRPEHEDGSPWVLRSDEVAQHPVEAYRLFAGSERAVVFAPNVPAAREFADDFNRVGIAADIVHSKMPKDERDSVLKLFARGELRVVCNVNILSEGWDDPGCSVCILARGCEHAGLYIQMVGRVMRPAPGKVRAILIDLRGMSYVHGLPAADRQYELTGVAIKTAEIEEERHCPYCNRILEGSGKCPNPPCQRVGESKALETPHSVDAKMVHVEWDDKMAGDPISARTARLAEWLRDARSKGHKAQAAVLAYKRIYGFFPSRRERQDAMLLAGVDEAEMPSEPPPEATT